MPEKEGFEDFVEAPPVMPAPVSTCKTETTLEKDVPCSTADLKWRPWHETEEDAKDPATLSASLMRLKASQSVTGLASTLVPASNSILVNDNERPGPSSAITAEESRKQKLMKHAPKLPYDVDLYHWEDEKLTAPTIEM